MSSFPPPMTLQELDYIEEEARKILGLVGRSCTVRKKLAPEARHAYLWLRFVGQLRSLLGPEEEKMAVAGRIEYCDLCSEIAVRVARDFREGHNTDGDQVWTPEKPRYGCDIHPPLPPRHIFEDGRVVPIATVRTDPGGDANGRD